MSCDSGAKYHLINLYREAIHDPESEGGRWGSNTQVLLAMDYFDAVEIMSFAPDMRDLRAFLGLALDDKMTENDVAMQSIPVYCPELDGTFLEYTKNAFYGDPFAKFNEEEDGLPYLGLIQVYITPEIIARYKTADNEVGSKRGIQENFYLDLHILLDSFAKQIVSLYSEFRQGSEVRINYRIYYSLSVGDFLVAVRSNRPDIPFYAASIVRKRRISFDEPIVLREKAEGAEELIDQLILYKTYTIISLDTRIIHSTESEGEIEQNSGMKESGTNEMNDKFVLRCVLSNKFWNDEDAKSFVSDNSDITSFLSGSKCWYLNGRYDLTFELTEQEYLEVHPLLLHYKLGKIREDEKSVGSETFLFLKELIEKGYVTYINERYIFRSLLANISSPNVNEDIKIDLGKGSFSFLIDINKNKINLLKKRIEETLDKVLRIDTSRHSIIYSMHLLNRLANTCSSINGISDSRIYCAVILYAMDAILNGVEKYIIHTRGEQLVRKIIESDKVPEDALLKVQDDFFEVKKAEDISEEDYSERVTALDNDLKQALEYLNSFSQYILDSSLQSIQTPHYNLETHISVEKLLIGYSSFMNTLINWYNSTRFYKSINKKMHTQENNEPVGNQYVTLMVPQALNSALSTCVLFNWNNNSSKFDKGFARILAVQCPSFNDLTDFSGTIGVLFHEVGHHFEYKTCDRRNEFVLRYCSNNLFELAAQYAVDDYEAHIAGFVDVKGHQRRIANLFSAKFKEYCKEHIGESIDSMSLVTLESEIERSYNKLIENNIYLERLRRYIKALLRDYTIPQDEGVDSIRRMASKLEKSMFDRSGADFPIKDIADTFRDLFYGIENLIYSEERRDIPEPYRQLHSLLEECFDTADDDMNNLSTYEEFTSKCEIVLKFNEEISKEYTDAIMDSARDDADGRRIARYLKLGRYAALDGYQKSFANFIWNYVELSRKNSIRLMREKVDMYREVVADLVLIRMLQLTPFGYFQFFAKNVEADIRLKESYRRRFVMVLYAMNRYDFLGKSSSKSTPSIEWSKMWLEIYKSTCECISSFFKEDDIQRKAEQGDIICNEMLGFARNILDSYKNHESVEDAAGYLAQVADILSYFQNQKGIEASTTFITGIIQCRYMCNNFLELYYSSLDELNSVDRFDFLSEEIKDAGNAFSDLYEEFEGSELCEYCEWIGSQYNKTVLNGDERIRHRIHSNKTVTDFIIAMNYKMLHESAVRIIG